MIIVETGIWASVFLYAIGWCTQFSLFQKRFNLSSTFGINSLLLACLLHSATLLYTIFSGFWSTHLIFDFLNAIAWAPIFIYLLLRKRLHSDISSSGIPLFTILILLLSTLFLKENIAALEWVKQAPFLHQALLITHITTLIAGYVLFGLSCISSVLFLYQEHQIKTKLVKILVHQFPSLTRLDQISYRSVILGFSFLTIGLILGILLSDNLQSSRSLGRLGFAFLIWFLYAFFLMERFFQGYKRRFIAIWSIIGFFLVLTSLIIETVHLI
ncbi:MAG: cytochrome c biogenesis protein CcsA [SAR324 cluster bacterium]|nr:cytochrome c biogenesis protein CcsA [SAR324 cluster bacterium]